MAGLLSGTQCHHLGMRAARPLRRPLAENPACLVPDDTSDARIGLCDAEGSAGQSQRHQHAFAIRRQGIHGSPDAALCTQLTGWCGQTCGVPDVGHLNRSPSLVLSLSLLLPALMTT
jgi:hypothetical protein